MAGAGDVDGNGHADLLVGADDAGEDGRGAAYLVLGPVQGSYQLEWADIEFGGDEEDEDHTSTWGATLEPTARLMLHLYW